MHIDVVPNRGSRPTYLLRESYREGAQVKKRTLANLSALSDEQIDSMRAVLRGESLQPAGDLFEVIQSLPHGHVQAVSTAMNRLGFAQLLSTRAQPERDLVCAMVAARILAPHTKLATTRWWSTTTLARQFAVEQADEDALYGAMDWLLARQGSIEKKLAARLQRIGEVLRADIENGRIPGAVVAIARKGKLVYYEAFGYADQEAGIAMPKDAIFRIASMAKLTTAVGVLMLHEEKRLSLEDPVEKHLPQLADRPVAAMRANSAGEMVMETVRANRSANIEDLMRHTAGIGYGSGGNTKVHKLYPSSTITAVNKFTGQEFLAELGKLPLQSQPGTAYQYGFGLLVAGLAIEAVTRQSLGQFLEHRLFRPLGMVDTVFVVGPEKVQRSAKPLPINPETGRPQRQRVRTTPWKFECGAACLMSTAGDYLRFAQMLLNRGTLGEARILSAQSVDYMTSDRIDSSVAHDVQQKSSYTGAYVSGSGAGVDTEYGYGLGVRVQRRDTASGSSGTYSVGGR